MFVSTRNIPKTNENTAPTPLEIGKTNSSTVLVIKDKVPQPMEDLT